MLTRSYADGVRAASGINILLGVWLLVSPWVFGYQAAGLAAIWNSAIVGSLIAIFAASNCFSRRIHTSRNWINVLLALWTMLSPLVYGYGANIGGFGDNLVLAILIAAFAIGSDEAAGVGEKQPPPSGPLH